MPTYEYQCPKCGVFEQFHSISSCLTHCPHCSSPVRRLISQNSNIIFKGSGFHSTDYRSGDYQKKAASESAPAEKASDSKTGSSSGSDSSSATSAASSKIESKAS